MNQFRSAQKASLRLVQGIAFAAIVSIVGSVLALRTQAAPVTPAAVLLPGALGYTTYVAPANLPNYDNAGEPSIGANWRTGNVLFQSSLTTFRVRFDDTQTPAAATWTNKSALTTSLFTLDPILFTDPVSGRTQVSQLAGKASLSADTDNDGDSWTVSQGTGINSGVDHQTIGGGAWAPGVTGLGLHSRAVYYCSQDIALAQCAVSRDGGLTYGLAVPIYNLLTCAGLHGHIKVAPNGTAYVPNKNCGGKQGVAVSTNNGTTWTVRKVPTSSAGDSDPAVSVGAGGRIFFGYHNSDGHARVAVSSDQGVSWSNDQDVGAGLGIQNIVFPTMIAGDNDRAAFAFLGTTTGGDYQNSNFAGVWHLYVATTYDGGQTWTTVDATPTDPVQRGSICTGGTTCGNDRNLLDFMDMTVDSQGRVLVGYADGCVAGCVQQGPNSFSAVATIARQSAGNGLFAAKD